MKRQPIITNLNKNKLAGIISFNPRSFLIILVTIILVGCTMPVSSPGIAQVPPAVQKAEITFTANALRPLGTEESMELVILDEVTGLPYNPERIPMTRTAEGKHQIAYPVRVGTMLTYRFDKITENGTRVPEVTPSGNQVRYRMVHVRQPATFEETIAGWENDLPDPTNTGSITGKVVTQDLGLPVRDMIVSAGGLQAVTDAGGNFTLFPLAAGQHNLVVISMNGSYKPFQSEAIIARDKVTPVEAAVNPTSWKQVTFNVEVPADTVEGAPIRLAGNLAQLGNTFIELGGGMSGDTKQMPVLEKTGDSQRSITLTLPAGIDIRYKYTLGDGFWNSEHGMDQQFHTHQLIIPEDEDRLEIQDQVFTWKTSNTAVIWFRVTTPENTPQDEQMGIQFFLSSWMPALPMFKIKENVWAFPLISPHNFTGEIPYRYCRNTPCTGAIQAGVESLESPRTTTTRFQEVHLVNDVVASWAFLFEQQSNQTELDPVSQRAEGFIAGISFTPYYTPTSRSYINALLRTDQKPYNHIVISPAWQAVSTQPPVLIGPTLDGTARTHEVISEIENAHQRGFSVSLFPQVTFQGNALNWWDALPVENQVTWKIWLDQYKQMIYQYAEIAEFTGVESFVMGGDWLAPSLPLGNNAQAYNLPGNIESIWQEIIAGIRQRYNGKIGWQLNTEAAKDPPAFLSQVEQFYLQWDIPAEPYQDLSELADQIGTNLDAIAEPLEANLGKPIIIVLAYPSLQGYQAGCISSPNDEGNCIDVSALLVGPSVENPAMTDLQAQADYYRAFIDAVEQRSWIDGVISQGYYPTNQIHDTSANIHGKPAESIYESWISLLLGN